MPPPPLRPEHRPPEPEPVPSAPAPLSLQVIIQPPDDDPGADPMCVALQVDESWTAHAVKAELAARLGLPPEQQRLLAPLGPHGRAVLPHRPELADEDTLSSYVVHDFGRVPPVELVLARRSIEQVEWLTRVKLDPESLHFAPPHVAADREAESGTCAGVWLVLGSWGVCGRLYLVTQLAGVLHHEVCNCAVLLTLARGRVHPVSGAQGRDCAVGEVETGRWRHGGQVGQLMSFGSYGTLIFGAWALATVYTLYQETLPFRAVRCGSESARGCLSPLMKEREPVDFYLYLTTNSTLRWWSKEQPKQNCFLLPASEAILCTCAQLSTNVTDYTSTIYDFQVWAATVGRVGMSVIKWFVVPLCSDGIMHVEQVFAYFEQAGRDMVRSVGLQRWRDGVCPQEGVENLLRAPLWNATGIPLGDPLEAVLANISLSAKDLGGVRRNESTLIVHCFLLRSGTDLLQAVSRFDGPQALDSGPSVDVLDSNVMHAQANITRLLPQLVKPRRNLLANASKAQSGSGSSGDAEGDARGGANSGLPAEDAPVFQRLPVLGTAVPVYPSEALMWVGSAFCVTAFLEPGPVLAVARQTLGVAVAPWLVQLRRWQQEEQQAARLEAAAASRQVTKERSPHPTSRRWCGFRWPQTPSRTMPGTGLRCCTRKS
ncbi:unnamed protein product [Prorocentrum cordatum]|uniref:Ubiquitin-like domain-containing protein n=1 Tax=Prorocentrum cordatum TaxID=2364126 RepID=A0ABN9VJI5_9DINO|nr:unnamed protein product [Polarella glacialis]